MTLDSSANLVKCWWIDIEMDCNDGFANHPSDAFASFTFNVGNKLKSVQDNIPIPDKPLLKPAYGLNASNYNENKFYVNSSKQGLRLLMKVNSDEYCGNDAIKRGSGFQFIIHDTDLIPSFLYDFIHYVSPGYNIDVAIRPIIYKRNLEHLGMCASEVNLYLFPFLKNTNKKIFCYTQCAAEMLLNECKCYFTPLLAFDKVFKDNSKIYHMKKDDIKVCLQLQDLKCMRKMALKIDEENTNTQCAYCKDECVEGKYEIQMTQTKLIKSNYRNLINVSEVENFERNYIMINFHFADMDLQTVEISQRFTLTDLFIYIGNNIGLFLGMSFMSSFEVVDLLMHVLQNIYIKKKNRVIPTSLNNKPVIRKRVKSVIIDRQIKALP